MAGNQAPVTRRITVRRLAGRSVPRVSSEVRGFEMMNKWSLKQAIQYVRDTAENEDDDEILALCERASKGDVLAIAGVWRCIRSLCEVELSR
jgi:hypothetical protein